MTTSGRWASRAGTGGKGRACVGVRPCGDTGVRRGCVSERERGWAWTCACACASFWACRCGWERGCESLVGLCRGTAGIGTDAMMAVVAVSGLVSGLSFVLGLIVGVSLAPPLIGLGAWAVEWLEWLCAECGLLTECGL